MDEAQIQDKVMALLADTDRLLADKKIRLFAEQATVASFSLAQSVEIISTVNGVVTRHESFKSGDLQKAFLQALDQKGMKYEIISHDDVTMTFAVSRDKYDEIKMVMDEFFSGARVGMMAGRGVMQSSDNIPFASLKNRILEAFDSDRREINQAVKRLNNG